MPSPTINQIILNGYRLVRSFATVDVRAQLQKVGLSDAEIERGRALVTAAQENRQAVQALRLSPFTSELRSWCRDQFPIIRAVLGDVGPDVYSHVFEGVQLTSTSNDLYFVEVVCKRVLALETSNDEADQTASKALVEHGITHDELVGALDKCVQKAHFEIASAESVKARDAAVQALHSFHKKWGMIARSRIKDRRVLRMMGVTRFVSASATEVAPTDGATPVATGATTPAVTNGATPVVLDGATPVAPTSPAKAGVIG